MIIISLHFCKQSLNLRIMPCNCTFTIKSFDIGDENCYLNGHAYIFLQSVTLFKPLCQFIRSQFYNIFLLAISIHDTAELTFCEAVLGGILSNYIVEVFKKRRQNMFKLRLRSFDTSKFFQSPHLVYHHPLLCLMARFQNPGKN